MSQSAVATAPLRPAVPSTRDRLDEAIDAHYREILAFAYSTAGPSQAEDIAQETFIRLARNLWKLEEGTNIRAWLYKVALNCGRDHFRRSSRQALLGDDASSTRAGPDELAHQRQLMREVRLFLSGLPRRQRLAFALRRLHDLDYGEIALVMHCSNDAARANVYQALKKLRDHFSGRTEI